MTSEYPGTLCARNFFRAGLSWRRFTVSLVWCCLAACAGPAREHSNFDNCLAEKRSCLEARLSAAELAELLRMRNQQHFAECLAGRRCDEDALPTAQRQEVRRAVSLLNFQACQRGESDCRITALTEAEKRTVENAETARNRDRCLNGLSSCKRWALTPGELAAAREAALRRNYEACLNSVGTLLPCDPEKLTREQNERVQERRRSVNLYICANALMGCVEDWLTPEERDAFAAKRATLAR